MRKTITDDDFLENAEQLIEKIDRLIFNSNISLGSVYAALACSVSSVLKETSDDQEGIESSWTAFKEIVDDLIKE